MCVAAMFLMATLVPCANAQRVTNGADPDVAKVMQYEREMWEAWQKKNLPALKALTSADYVTVSEIGEATWKEVEAAFPDTEIRGYTIGDMSAVRVTDDVIILSYPAEIRGSYKTTDLSRKVAECSVWRREKGKWMNLYLHEVTVK